MHNTLTTKPLQLHKITLSCTESDIIKRYAKLCVNVHSLHKTGLAGQWNYRSGTTVWYQMDLPFQRPESMYHPQSTSITEA